MDDPKAYPVSGPGDSTPPNYERGVRALSDAELEDEILSGRGEPGYQIALLAEADRRGQAPPPEPTTKSLAYDAGEWD